MALILFPVENLGQNLCPVKQSVSLTLLTKTNTVCFNGILPHNMQPHLSFYAATVRRTETNAISAPTITIFKIDKFTPMFLFLYFVMFHILLPVIFKIDEMLIII
jgi:hypothetical protein